MKIVQKCQKGDAHKTFQCVPKREDQCVSEKQTEALCDNEAPFVL